VTGRQLLKPALLLRSGALLLRAEAAGLADCHCQPVGDSTGEPDAQAEHDRLISAAEAMEAQAIHNERFASP
jgi:hypothetical protein